MTEENIKEKLLVGISKAICSEDGKETLLLVRAYKEFIGDNRPMVILDPDKYKTGNLDITPSEVREELT